MTKRQSKIKKTSLRGSSGSRSNLVHNMASEIASGKALAMTVSKSKNKASQSEKYASFYTTPQFSEEARPVRGDASNGARWAVAPFVTSLEAPVYSFRSHLLPPQLLGALFSRASRAKGDLREVFWKEYLAPILQPRSEDNEAQKLAQELREIIAFHYAHANPPYNTKRAYNFFAKWLAQYGDDSIAQMASSNIVWVAASQPALKFVEDQRIGLSPIEKSTRYVDYGVKINGHYLYYTDPRLAGGKLGKEYRRVMDRLFTAYRAYVPELIGLLQKDYPQEKADVVEKKAFDVMRGLLPMATVSQVAFHGNAQALQYMINRCAAHPRGELRWFAQEARRALDEEIPALLLRLDDAQSKRYQKERVARKKRVAAITQKEFSEKDYEQSLIKPQVRLVEYDPAGQEKIITALLFDEGNSRLPWGALFNRVRSWSDAQKDRVLKAHLRGRKARWEKIGRAFENAFVRFEIIMNAGAYRDLHRHRMHTQQRQRFTTHLGYELPPEIERYGFLPRVRRLMKEAETLFAKVEAVDTEIAQDVVTLSHLMRFYQYQNIRQVFWEGELRTISQGRPDYRWIEQEKYRLLSSVYPLIMKYMLIDMNEYDFARRGVAERIQKKEAELKERLGASSIDKESK